MKKINTICDLAAMLMVLLITAVPHHHHHQAMICIVQEECAADHRYNDEHTMHHDSQGSQQEVFCVAYENYFPADELHVQLTAPAALNDAAFACTVAAAAFSPTPLSALRPLSAPPILTWRINC